MLPPAIETARRWLDEGRRVAACTLVETVGSAPLGPGAEMLVDDRGAVEGSVTGGCVEAALVEHALAVLAGDPPRVATFGVADDEAAGAGLTCGGTVRVFVHELRERATLDAVAAATARGEPVALATLLDGPAAGGRIAAGAGEPVGTLGGPALLDHSVGRDARGFLDEGRSGVRRYSVRGETLGADLRVAIHAFAAPRRMLIFGAVDFSAALARMATDVGYAVTIADARPAFARAERFAAHARVVVGWPADVLARMPLGPRDAVLVFTHDPKFDEPALHGALSGAAGYVGALGSRRTVADRAARLRAAGVGEAALERLRSPCGLDVGASTPAETAVAVLAEILALRSGRTGVPLRATGGAIHGSTI